MSPSVGIMRWAPVVEVCPLLPARSTRRGGIVATVAWPRTGARSSQSKPLWHHGMVTLHTVIEAEERGRASIVGGG
jgi:hypothetical protein